jgi:hypothetical protein
MGVIKLKVKCSNVQGILDIFEVTNPEQTLKDLSDWIWEKHETEIIEYNRREVSNLVHRRDRIIISFFFINSIGEREILDYTDVIMDLILSYKIDLIYWQMPAIGGGSARQIFGQHALEIIERQEYKYLKCITRNKPGDGIKVVAKDKDGVTRTINIVPSESYPKKPPRVKCVPDFNDDTCWIDSTLNYTRFTNKEGSPWKDLVSGADGMPPCSNPLISIIIELRQKYGFMI